MTFEKRLARLQKLKDDWWAQAHSVIAGDRHYQEGKLSEIREAIHTVQFELLLHTPCYRLTHYVRMFW